MARPSAHRHDFLGWTITAIVSLTGDGVHPQVVPTPSAGDVRSDARTIKCLFMQEPGNQRHQIRPVPVRTEARQISRAALRTLDATANTRCHGTNPRR